MYICTTVDHCTVTGWSKIVPKNTKPKHIKMSQVTKNQSLLPSKWEVTALIWVAYFLNQADRQVFNVVLPQIRDGLGLTDSDMGLIATAFNLFYAVLVPLGGLLGDRYSRKWILTLCILFWSVATMFTGWATGLVSLIILRSIATGGGEAMFGPNYNALLSEYHTKTRSTAMAIVQTSYYIGIIASGFLAGKIADMWGWQYAFIVFGAVGVLHAIVMMIRLKDKRDVNAERAAAGKSNLLRDLVEGFTVIFRTPTAALVTIGFAGLIFVLTGYLTWMPTYLQEAPFNMTSAEAGFHSMFYTHFAAFFGVLIAGKLSDYLGAKGKPAMRTAMQGLGLLAAAPCLYYMGHSTSTMVVFGALAIFGFARAFFDANTYVVLYDVVPAKFHSSASGVMIMIGFGTGALAPYLLGLIKESSSLSLGFTILAAIWVVCGVIMIVGGKLFYQRDLLKLQKDE